MTPLTPEQFDKAIIASIPYVKHLFKARLAGSIQFMEADDLVQVAAERALRNYRNCYEPTTGVEGLLYSIGMNYLRSQHLKLKRMILSDDMPEVLHRFGFNTIADTDQESAMIYQQDLEAFSGLDPDQQKILQRYAEGWTYEEIAAVLNVPLGTVRSRMNRARNRLVELIGGDSDETWRQTLDARRGSASKKDAGAKRK